MDFSLSLVMGQSLYDLFWRRGSQDDQVKNNIMDPLCRQYFDRLATLKNNNFLYHIYSLHHGI